MSFFLLKANFYVGGKWTKEQKILNNLSEIKLGSAVSPVICKDSCLREMHLWFTFTNTEQIQIHMDGVE